MYISVICADKIQPVPLGILRIDLQLQSIRMENQKKNEKTKNLLQRYTDSVKEWKEKYKMINCFRTNSSPFASLSIYLYTGTTVVILDNCVRWILSTVSDHSASFLSRPNVNEYIPEPNAI